MASTSSSASNSQGPRQKYDVFLSFRGEDTRSTFTSHLYEGLKNRGIQTFKDDIELKYGDRISEELLTTIEESQVALVIFSKDYATSRWCLDELVRIMECNKKKNGQTVMSVFYNVDPSHVRHQRDSFAEAFAKHESNYKDDVEGMQKVQGWRAALREAANLSGCDTRNRIESECIRDLVDQISKLCKTSLSYLKDIVGIDTHLEEVKALLQMEVNDVRIVGIWGMGGVGKTTIARAIFDNLSWQFKAACLLENVKEIAKKNPLYSVQNILLSRLLGKEDRYVYSNHEGKNMISKRFGSLKVLIVLDDIDHNDHLEYLAGDVSWFGNGSRVVVTTRDKRLIEKGDAIIYKVTPLPDLEAMRLFNQHAFKGKVPDEFKDLSLKVVNYAKGLPLALVVWGSMLYKREIDVWTSAMEEMRNNSDSDVDKNLRISYDGLKAREQTIFLDIACFFRGDGKQEVMQILESCHLGAKYNLNVLIEKSLLFISENDTIQMHDLIQDMGQNIVKMQKDPGERSRLWDAEEIKEVMIKNTGTKAVEAIWHYIDPLFNHDLSEDLSDGTCFSKEAMENMKMLRILQIQTYKGSVCDDAVIEYLSNNLCWLVWHFYPWKSLPAKFEPKKLVHLELKYSKLCQLWKETKHFPCLRKLNLTESEYLMQTPDFREMPNLEYLDLSFCHSLEEVDGSLGYCGKLIQLHLGYCTSLKMFPCVNVESLEYLDLEGCPSLEKFPEIKGRSKLGLEIAMIASKVRELPSFILYLTHLTELDLRCMKNLVSLPSSIGMLKSLVKLNVSYCSKLESLPEKIGDLENLEELYARYTLISRPLPSIVRLNKLKFLSFRTEILEVGLQDGVCFEFPRVKDGLRSLEDLNLSYCNLIDGGLPEDIGSLSSLKWLNLNGNNFERLPRSIAQLGALQSLDLSNCKRLKELPGFMGMPNLVDLNLRNCDDLEEVDDSLGYCGKLIRLHLGYCTSLKRFPCVNVESLEYLDLFGCSSLEKFPEIRGRMKPELKIKMEDSGIRELPSSFFQSGTHLTKLDLSLKHFVALPSSIGMLKSLVELDVRECSKLGSLPEEIGDLENLERLDADSTLISRPPSSIARLNKLKFLSFKKQKPEVGLQDGVCFEFPQVNDGLRSLENLNLSYCNLIDGGLPEDIGSLSSLKRLNLNGNNFERLPRSIAQLCALQYLYLSDCKRLKELPGFTGMPNLVDLNLDYCDDLEEVDDSLGYCGKLIQLHLVYCTSLKRFPCVNVESLEDLDLFGCSSLEKFPEIRGRMKPELQIEMKHSRIRELPSSFFQSGTHLTKLDLSLKHFVALPRSISMLKSLVKLNVSYCSKLESLPEEIGDLENLERLDTDSTLISRPPSSIVRLNKLKHLYFGKEKSEVGLQDGVYFKFPRVKDGLRSLEDLNLSYCNLIDGGLPEDIGSLSSLKRLNLNGNNFERLPRSIAQLGALQSLDLSDCKRLKELPGFMEMPNLVDLNLGNCDDLEEVDDSLGYCGKLIRLHLGYCTSLKRVPCVNVESLEYLDLFGCSSLEKFPEIRGRMKPELKIEMEDSGIRELPSSYFQSETHLTKLDLSFMKHFVALPSSIGMLKSLVELDVSRCIKLKSLPEEIGRLQSLVELDVSSCSKLESLPEEIGDLENLEKLDARYTLISRPPSSIARLNNLKFLSFKKQKPEVGLEDGVCFEFPQVNDGLRSLEYLNLGYCNLIDGGLPEDIGSLSSLKELSLVGNNFEHLPRSIAQLGALRCLKLADCVRLKVFPQVNDGLGSLEELDLSYCNLRDGLPEDIGSLSSLKKLNLNGNNFEHLPRSIAQLGALRILHVFDCMRLTQLPEFPQKLDTINANWSNDWICNSLFQNISSLQHISASDSLSLRVFTSCEENIPSWFRHQGMDTSVSASLPENWYLHDNFLGFAICYAGRLVEITAQLIPLCDDGMSSMTQKLALSDHSECDIDFASQFFLVPLSSLWDTSKANGKTPNDYGCIRLSFSGETDDFGLRLLYKDEPSEASDKGRADMTIVTRKSRYDDSEASSSSSDTCGNSCLYLWELLSLRICSNK